MDFIQGEIRTQKSLFPQYLDDYSEPDSYVRVVEAYVESLDMKTLEFKKSQLHISLKDGKIQIWVKAEMTEEAALEEEAVFRKRGCFGERGSHKQA